MRRAYRRVLLLACAWVAVALGDCRPASADSKWVWVAPPWDEQAIASLPKYVEIMMRVYAVRLPKDEEAKALEPLGSSGLSPRTIQRFRVLLDRQYADVKANKPGTWWMTTIDEFVEADMPPTRWHQIKAFDSVAACEGARIHAWHIAVNRLRRAEEELNVELATQPFDRWATIGERGTHIAKDAVMRQSSCVPAILLY